MAELSPETLAKFRDFRKAKLGAAAGRIGQVLGGAAETLGTGRSAADTFAARDPDLLRQKRLQEFYKRQSEKTGLVKNIAAEEQFYYNQEQQERMAVLSDIQAEMQRLSQIAMTDARLTQQGAEAKARLQSAAELREANLMADELKQAYGLTPAGKQVLEQVTAKVRTPGAPSKRELDDRGIGEAVFARLTDEQRVGMIERGWYVQDGPDSWTLAPGRRANELATAMEVDTKTPEWADIVGEGRTRAADEMAKQMAATGVDPSAAFSDALRTIEASELDDHQKHNAIVAAASYFGMDDNAVDQVLGPDSRGGSKWAAILEGHNMGITTKEQLLGIKMKRHINTSGKTFGGRVEKYLGELPSLMERFTQATEMAKETSPLKGEDLDMDGIPDVEWAPSATDRFTQALDLMDQYPDKPPMQHLKSQLMGSPEFQQFKQHYGYSDDQFAFREMNRLARRQQKANRMSDRKRRKMNLQQQLGGYKALPVSTEPGTPTDRPDKQRKPKDSEDLVTGATGSRIAEN